jgi:hypothetical protein
MTRGFLSCPDNPDTGLPVYRSLPASSAPTPLGGCLFIAAFRSTPVPAKTAREPARQPKASTIVAGGQRPRNPLVVPEGRPKLAQRFQRWVSIKMQIKSRRDGRIS